MDITFKLFATLTDYLPPEAKYTNQLAMQVDEGSTVQQVVDRFHLPPKLVHLALVNGHYIAHEKRASHVLNQGDVLAVWPPIAGG